MPRTSRSSNPARQAGTRKGAAASGRASGPAARASKSTGAAPATKKGQSTGRTPHGKGTTAGAGGRTSGKVEAAGTRSSRGRGAAVPGKAQRRAGTSATSSATSKRGGARVAARPGGSGVQSKAGASARAPAKARASRAATPKLSPTRAAERVAEGKTLARRAGSGTPAGVATRAPKTRQKVTDKFLLEQQGLLRAERATYVEQAEDLKAEADSLAQDMEPGDVQFDEESGEGGTVTVDRERDLALSAQARAAIEDIDHALAKIEAGTYGVCEGCGQPIPKARLKALPQARMCVTCKSGGLSRR
jgi:DnaK suppressor protein